MTAVLPVQPLSSAKASSTNHSISIQNFNFFLFLTTNILLDAYTLSF